MLSFETQKKISPAAKLTVSGPLGIDSRNTTDGEEIATGSGERKAKATTHQEEKSPRRIDYSADSSPSRRVDERADDGDDDPRA